MPDLEVIGPKGVVLQERGLDAVVVRRREERFASGSEVAIRPGHAPLLMQTCGCRLRWHRGGCEYAADVGAGVLEVLDDRVTLVLTG